MRSLTVRPSVVRGFVRWFVGFGADRLPVRLMARKRSAVAVPPSGARVITRTVSSPAMVPRMSAGPTRSMAEAKYWAAPGGVRSTTRLADASAETSTS